MNIDPSRTPSVGAAVIAALTLFALLVPSSVGAEEPARPPYYAIRDARVVTVSGDALERATVLVADGLIEAVGADLEIPEDAWVIEGAGLTVYPGLIDALTTLGQKPPEEEQGGGRGGGGGSPFGGGQQGPEIRGPEDRPRTTPWVSAADELSLEDSRVEKWREAGFTAAVSSPDDGFFAGQAAMISLGGDEPEQMVVATPVAQRIDFSRGRGRGRGYPGSLMGILSYVKQVLSDTQHYQQAQEIYEQSPRGLQRPAYDRTLQPILDAMTAQLPFLLPGDLGREIDRSLKIAEEYGIRPVIYGGQGAYSRIDRLAASKVPVLVSLEWPEEERGRDPEADTDFRELYHRRAAPTTPQRLSAAGVPFAFYSGGASSPADALEGVRAAVDAGLDPDRALRALTLDAAEIFGVADRLGSIDRGKIANLVVASAEPWAEDAEILAVFVDGRLFAKPAEKEPAEAPEVDVTGTWALRISSPRGERESTARLEMSEDGKVTGEVESPRGSSRIEDGRVSGTTLSFTISQSAGPRTFEASYRAEIEGEQLTGSISAGPMAMEVSGERTAGAETRTAEAGDDEGPSVTMEELDEVLAIYQGKVREYGTFAITNATVWTVSGETIPNGTVLVEDGKIAAVGADVRVPRGAEVIDAEGGHLTPGIIDTHSHLGVDGGVNEGSLAVTSMVTIADVVDPDDVGIYRALAGGVTAANTLHGSANPIGGGNAVIKYRWGADADAMIFEGAPPGIKFALGENPKRSRAFPGSNQRYPATRMGVMDVIREAFVEAKQYQKEWQQYEAAKRAGKNAIPPRRDFKLESLVEILEGERLVHSHCYRADEMLQLLRLAEEQGFRVATLQHVLEGYKVADEIAEHGAGAGTFSDWWGYKVEAYDAIPYNAALMTERGVVVSINSDSSEEIRHLNQEAAKAVKWGGMDEIGALKLVTLNPAIQLRVEDRVGSIEVGKDADLALFDGHPLSMFSVVQKTFVDGDLYFDHEADRERQRRIDEIKKRLLGKDDEGEAEGGEPPTTTPETPDTTPNTEPNRDPQTVAAGREAR